MLLLWHHLFANLPAKINIKFSYLVSESAQSANVCIAIFIILSGYGLAQAVKGKKMGVLSFYKKYFARLYLNYWLIAAIFIPIGIVFKDRTLSKVFLEQKYWKFAIQMTGFQDYFYFEGGFNSTWWYMSLILSLYILFPFINDLTRKYGLYFLLFCLLPLFPIGIGLPVVQPWILPFALGVYMADRNSIVRASALLNAAGRLRYGILASLIVTAALVKKYGFHVYRGYCVDWVYGLLIILLTFEIINSSARVRVFLCFLGKHLFNIFLFHTFIYFYYWADYVYFFKHPLVIFIVLLAVSLVVSMMIELLKKHIYFYRLAKSIENISLSGRFETML